MTVVGLTRMSHALGKEICLWAQSRNQLGSNTDFRHSERGEEGGGGMVAATDWAAPRGFIKCECTQGKERCLCIRAYHKADTGDTGGIMS